MTVESATYLASLDATYPAGTDAKSEGDDHIRLIKSVLKATFPNMSSAVTASPTALNNIFMATGGTLAGDIAMGNNDIGGIKTASFTAEYDAGNSGTTKTIDWNNGLKQKLTLTGNCTLTFTAPPGVSHLVLHVIQGSGTTYNLVWPAAVEWPSSSTPTVTSAESRHDIFTFYYNGTTYFGASSQNYNLS